MAGFSLPANAAFPSGTAVGAYAPPQPRSPLSAPFGSPITTATAGAGGATTFPSGLADATTYAAVAQVGETWRRILFTTLAPGGVGSSTTPGPQGAPGPKGDKGDKGDQGEPGDATALIGAVATESTARGTWQSGHLVATDPHGDRAYTDARITALLAANPSLIAPP